MTRRYKDEIHRRELVCDCGSDCGISSGRICNICFLERMKKMLESNKAMQTLVSGEAGEVNE